MWTAYMCSDIPHLNHIQTGSGGTRRRKPKLLRRFTFQVSSANAYAVNTYELGLGGEVILSPTSKSSFAFKSLLSTDSPLSPTSEVPEFNY